MTRLAFALFALVLGTHYGYEPLAQITAAKPATWFYVLRGIEGMVLYLLVLALLPRRNLTAMAVCVWGSIEEGLTAACRLGVGVNNPPADRSQCDAITGLPIYATTLVVVLWVLIQTTKDR